MSDAAVYAFGKATLTGMGASEAELQFTLTVCRHETGYSTGWPPGAGLGSNNWGAITAPVSAPHFDHEDTHADGKKFVSHFRVYPSPTHGLMDAFTEICKPNVRAALARGDGVDAVKAMRANGYFEASVESYIKAMRNNYERLVRGAALKPAIHFDGTGSNAFGTLVLLGMAALLMKGRHG